MSAIGVNSFTWKEVVFDLHSHFSLSILNQKSSVTKTCKMNTFSRYRWLLCCSGEIEKSVQAGLSGCMRVAGDWSGW